MTEADRVRTHCNRHGEDVPCKECQKEIKKAREENEYADIGEALFSAETIQKTIKQLKQRVYGEGFEDREYEKRDFAVQRIKELEEVFKSD